MRKLEGRIVVHTYRYEEVRPILERAWPDLPVDYGVGRDFLGTTIGEAEILYTYRFSHSVLKHARRLRWIQGTGAGADQFLPFEDLPLGVLVSNAAGINAEIMADFAMGLVLALQHNLKRYVEQQREHLWKRELSEPLAGKALAILGLGRIGRGVARRAKAMGMRVTGTRRSGASVDGVDVVYGPAELPRVLEQADYVVLTVPLTPATRNLIDAKALEAMRPTAFLINISRGPVVDEAALIDALIARRIAGAALDVFNQEPLPPESPLWGVENLILTPHIGGDMKDFVERSAAIFCENIGRYLRGEPLLNPVDLARGY